MYQLELVRCSRFSTLYSVFIIARLLFEVSDFFVATSLFILKISYFPQKQETLCLSFFDNSWCVCALLGISGTSRSHGILVSKTLKIFGIFLMTYFPYSLDNQYRTADLLYTKPYTRVGPYLVGFWGGWYLSKINRKLPFHKVNMLHTLQAELFYQQILLQNTIFLGWILTIATTTLLVFGQHYQKPDATVGGLYAAFGRSLWGLAVTFIIIACSSGNGGNEIIFEIVYMIWSRIQMKNTLLRNYLNCKYNERSTAKT